MSQSNTQQTTQQNIISGIKYNWINRNSIVFANEFVVKLYYKTCYRLYQLGYASKPFETDMQEVLSVLRVEFPNIYDFITNTYAGIVCSKPLMFKYVLHKLEEDHTYLRYSNTDLDPKLIIQLLYDLSYCEQGFATLEEIRQYFVSKGYATTYGFPRTNRLMHMVNNTSSDSLFSENFMGIFYKDLIALSTHIYEIPELNDLLKQTFLEDIGASKISDMIQSEYIGLYISGDLDLPFEADVIQFKNRVRQYYKDEIQKTRLSNSARYQILPQSYYNYIFNKAVSKINNLTQPIAYCDGSSFYSYSKSTLEPYQGRLVDAILHPDNDMGADILDQTPKYKTDLTINQIAGYSGEYIKATVALNTYKISGYPVVLIQDDHTEYYYPIKSLRQLDDTPVLSKITRIPITQRKLYDIAMSYFTLKGTIDINTTPKPSQIPYRARTLLVHLVKAREGKCYTDVKSKFSHEITIKTLLQNKEACALTVQWYKSLYD